jgi:hypothetical protein
MGCFRGDAGCLRGDSDAVCPRVSVMASKSAFLIASRLRRSHRAINWGWEEEESGSEKKLMRALIFGWSLTDLGVRGRLARRSSSPGVGSDDEASAGSCRREFKSSHIKSVMTFQCWQGVDTPWSLASKGLGIWALGRRELVWDLGFRV